MSKLVSITLLLFLTCLTKLSAQTTAVKGRVYDKDTREPLAYSNIYFGRTNVGVIADFEGNFELQVMELESDTLFVYFFGYKLTPVIITRGIYQEVEVELERQVVEQTGVQITAKGNPAIKWIQLAQEHREENNPDKLDFYECESFTKVSVAVNNISNRIKNGKLGKDIGGLFDTISYVSQDQNSRILPVFFSETVSDFYFNKNPRLTKEVIKGSRIKGVGVSDGTFVSQVMGSTFISYNFYQNTLVVIDKGIISPIAAGALNLYNYKLIGVDKSGPRRIFQIQVEPKNPKDLAFKGQIWIQDTTGALVRLVLEINNTANLNFIEKLKITQEYIPTSKRAWFLSLSRVVVDAAEVNTNAAGIVATSTISYKKIQVENEHPIKFFDERVVLNPNALKHHDAYWDSIRHTPLNQAEKRIYNKIDTLMNLPRVRTYVDVLNFLVDGYKPIGKVDWGPWFNLASYNNLEGFRVRMGFRTNIQFSNRWILKGFLAYGFKDQQWKYSLQAEYIANRKRWTKIGGRYRADVEQIGLTDNDDLSSGIFTAMNLIGSNNLNFNREAKFWIGTDVRPGVRITLSAGTRLYEFSKVGPYNFAWYPFFPDTQVISQNFRNSTITAHIRYARRDYFLQNDNRRVNFTGIGPVYYATIVQGFKGVLGSEFNYTKMNLGLDFNRVWGVIGRTSLNIEFAKVFGRLPYPLLNIYVGNQSFVYSTRAYNQMRIFEFVTDQSASLGVEHHFNGFFFNRVPLIKKWKWREIIGFKGIYGTLDQRNFDIIPKKIGDDPITQFKTFNDQPYLEIGYGIENIFKVIRVDAIHRLTYRNEPKVRNFGVKVSFALAF